MEHKSHNGTNGWNAEGDRQTGEQTEFLSGSVFSFGTQLLGFRRNAAAVNDTLERS